MRIFPNSSTIACRHGSLSRDGNDVRVRVFPIARKSAEYHEHREEGEKQSISGVENNCSGGRCRGEPCTISAVPGEGGDRRQLSSAALRCFRFSEGPVCFATRGESACSTYNSAKSFQHATREMRAALSSLP